MLLFIFDLIAGIPSLLAHNLDYKIKEERCRYLVAELVCRVSSQNLKLQCKTKHKRKYKQTIYRLTLIVKIDILRKVSYFHLSSAIFPNDKFKFNLGCYINVISTKKTRGHCTMQVNFVEIA